MFSPLISFIRHLFFITLVLLTGCSTTSSKTALLGTTHPSTRLTMISGEERALSSFQDKTVLLIFWASYCPYSKSLLSDIKPLADRFKERSSVAFIAISVDAASRLAVVESFIKEYASEKVQFSFSGNDAYDEAYRVFEGEEIPYLVLLDHHGVVRYAGHDLDDVTELMSYL
jgi:thiol-disulfide isomerase/thioredoxin